MEIRVINPVYAQVKLEDGTIFEIGPFKSEEHLRVLAETVTWASYAPGYNRVHAIKMVRDYLALAEGLGYIGSLREAKLFVENSSTLVDMLNSKGA